MISCHDKDWFNLPVRRINASTLISSPSSRVQRDDPSSMSCRTLLLRSELWSTNVTSSQLNTENSFEVSEDFLIWRSGTLLIFLYYRRGSVALCGKVFLCHFWLDLVPPLDDCKAYYRTDGLWLDDVVASVDFGKMLAFGWCFLDPC